MYCTYALRIFENGIQTEISMNAQRLQPIHMDCGETSMRLTHQNRLKHLVPSLSHTGVNQDTHMLGACHASFNHINSVLWFRPYPHHDLTTLRVSVHQRSYSKSPTKLITVSVAVKACSSRSVSKLTRATLRRRIMNVIATPQTPHPTPGQIVYLSLPCRLFLSEEVASCCFFSTGLGNVQTWSIC